MPQPAQVPAVDRSSARFANAARYYRTGRPSYPPLLIARVAEDVATRLPPFAVDGVIHEVVEGVALIARRPS
jgi:hypothetical protein